MAPSNVISLGIGSPSSVEHFVTLGLEAEADVLLAGGETGYLYPPVAGGTPILEVSPSGTGPNLTSGPAVASGSAYTYDS